MIKSEFANYKRIDEDVQEKFDQIWNKVSAKTGCHAFIFNTQLNHILHYLNRMMDEEK